MFSWSLVSRDRAEGFITGRFIFLCLKSSGIIFAISLLLQGLLLILSSFSSILTSPGKPLFVGASNAPANIAQAQDATLWSRPKYALYLPLPVWLAVSTALGVSYHFIQMTRYNAKEQGRLAKEVQNARDIQMRLMPQSAPEVPGFDISGICLPSYEMSGDFYNYFWMDKSKQKLGIAVADVTGKAMQAAMVAMLTNGMLQTAMDNSGARQIGDILSQLNRNLRQALPPHVNVTMVIGMLDAEKKRLTFANAGHHAHPILLRGGKTQFLKARGLPLGIKAGIEYSEEEFALESGDVVIFMTDGIIEAENIKGVLYSESGRLERTLSQLSLDLPAKSMIDAIIKDVNAFGGAKTSREDDMTVVVAKVR